MAIKTVVQLPFTNAAKATSTFSLVDPKVGLTLAECAATQALMIATNVFSTTGGDLITALPPKIITTNTVELV